jgi:MFS superfamily sulfate permease-like transporter
MPREINNTQAYSDKIVKLIPTEIVGAYMVLAGILGFSPAQTAAVQAEETKAVLETAVKNNATIQEAVKATAKLTQDQLNPILIQIVFFVLLALTPVFLRVVSGVSNKMQLCVATFSYVVWIYTLGGPFVVWEIYYPIIGSVVLVLWSISIPLVVSGTNPPNDNP